MVSAKALRGAQTWRTPSAEQGPSTLAKVGSHMYVNWVEKTQKQRRMMIFNPEFL